VSAAGPSLPVMANDGKRAVPTDPLESLRKLCLAMPESTERVSHGEPTWFVRDKKTFVTYAGHHHDDRVGFWCAAPPGAQEALVASAPDRFFRPPYVGHRGWLGVYLDVPVDWDEIAEIVEDAFRMVAPQRLSAQLDADQTSIGASPGLQVGGSRSGRVRAGLRAVTSDGVGS
jgi:hypothetical protein